MKESGINFFFNQLGLDTGDWGIFYTFEEGAGSSITNISGAQTGFSGALSSIGNFWDMPGSGHSTGQSISIANASGLFSDFWTMMFAWQKTTPFGGTLFSNTGLNSGFEIGLTDSNKVYFTTNNQTVSNTVSMGDKNVVAVSYLPNTVTFNYYNFNAQKIEAESFIGNFNVQESDTWTLLPRYTGYIDYFLYFSNHYSPALISQLCSGFWAYYTGIIYPTETITIQDITGYQQVSIIQTGVTGYSGSQSGNEGINYYTGEFPLTGNYTPLTGIISTNTFYSGVTGLITAIATGAPSYGYTFLTGYVASFGLDKILIFDSMGVNKNDIIKSSFATVPWNWTFNKNTLYQYSGFLPDQSFTGLGINIFQNGAAVNISGWNLNSGYAFITGADINDNITYDYVTGTLRFAFATGLPISFAYTGQEIFLNGVNLVSGYDFKMEGTNAIITGNFTGATGILFDFPYGSSSNTGNSGIFLTQRFLKDSSQVYINGVRQVLGTSCIEGTRLDMLSGNYYSNEQSIVIYNDNDLFWDL